MGERISAERKRQIKQFVETAAQLDEQSLLQLQFTANVLLARERQVQRMSEKEVFQCAEA